MYKFLWRRVTRNNLLLVSPFFLGFFFLPLKSEPLVERLYYDTKILSEIYSVNWITI